MTGYQLGAIRGFIEENYDAFAEYLSKGSGLEACRELHGALEADEIFTALGEALDFTFELEDEFETLF